MRINRLAVVFLVTALAGTTWITTSAAGQNDKNDRQAESALQAAKNREQVDGNLEAAIKQYKGIVSKYPSQRAIVADALIHMAESYQKLGNAEAGKIYEQVVKDYSDQKDVAADAGRRLAALSVLPSSDKLAPRLVATAAVKNSDESISLDGRSMALTIWSGSGDRVDLAVQDMSTGQLKRLLVGSCAKAPCTFPESPILSPDSRQVAYTWYDDDENKGQGQLRVVANEPGAKPRILIRNPEFGSIWAAGWSPDGKSILVSVHKEKDRTSQIGWVSVADGNLRVLKLLDWRRPILSLSFDGRYIAYSAMATNPSKATPAATDSRDTHIYILAADGSSEVDVVKTAGVNQDPVWTPDGKHLLFLSDRSGTLDLWSVPVREGNASAPPSMVRKGIGSIGPMGMTRSGSYYYNQSKAAVEGVQVEQVSIAELIPGGGSRITDSFVGMAPTWLQNGKSLVFLRHSTRGGAQSFDLLTRSVDTADEKVFSRNTSLEISAVPARWYHDGSGLLQNSRSQSADCWSIYFIGKTSEELKLVYPPCQPGTTRSASFALSPDDKTLYLYTGVHNPSLDRIAAFDISSGQSKVVLMLPGTEETLPRTGGGGIGITLSPDGRTLAFTTINSKTKEAHLALVRIDGSDYHEIYTAFKTTNLAEKLAWTKDGRSIVFATTADDGSGTSQIMRIGIEGGKPEFTGLAVKGLTSFSLSPDDSRIAFGTTGTAASSISELWAIDNLPALLKD